MHICIDFETRSAMPLSGPKSVGAYRYAEDPTTEVLFVAYALFRTPMLAGAVPRDKVHLIDARHGDFGALAALAADPDNIWHAHNASFERCIWREIMHGRHGLPDIPIERWRCSMAAALQLGLPASLEDLSAVLELPEQKSKRGKELIAKLCKPAKATKKRAAGWNEDPALMEELGEYCRQDVLTELAAIATLGELPLREQELWQLDQRINDRGIRIDRPLVEAAIRLRDEEVAKLDAEVARITGLQSATQSVALREWIAQRINPEWRLEGVSKDALLELLTHYESDGYGELPSEVREVILLRQAGSLSSLAKLDRMLECASPRDDRIRGTLQYHGASTGRWAARLVQTQNLARPSKDHDLGALVDCIMDGDPSLFEMALGVSPIQALFDAMRNMFLAAPGRVLVSCDFASIEARVLAVGAGEHWKVDLFANGGDAYIAAAEAIYPELAGKITKKERQTGKVAELALGFQGWVGAFQAMAAKYKMRLDDDFCATVCSAWRKKHPAVVAFWAGLESAAVLTVSTKEPHAYEGVEFGIRRVGRHEWLTCKLPSGRKLHYYSPRVDLEDDPYKPGKKKPVLSYMSFKTSASGGRTYRRITSYGGMLTENWVQAVARDLLVDAVFRAEAAGFSVILLVHDELDAEVDIGHKLADHRILEELMCEKAPWCQHYPIAAEGWTGFRYQK